MTEQKTPKKVRPSLKESLDIQKAQAATEQSGQPVKTNEKPVDVIGKVQATGSVSLPAARKTFKQLPNELCRPWKHHDRSEYWITDSKIRSLAESIKKTGQKQLGLVRKTVDSDGATVYEIIYGVLRWHACKLAGVNYSAEVAPEGATDNDLFELMDDENALSQDISELERYASYYRAITQGLTTAEEIQTKWNVGRSTFFRWQSAGKISTYPLIWESITPVIAGVSLRDAVTLSRALPEDLNDGVVASIKDLPDIAEGLLRGEGKEESDALLKKHASMRMKQLINIIQETEIQKPEAGKGIAKKVKSSHVKQQGKAVLSSVFNPANGSTRLTLDKELILKFGGDKAKLMEYLDEAISELAATWKDAGLVDD